MKENIIVSCQVSKVNYCNNSYQIINYSPFVFIEPAHTILSYVPTKRTTLEPDDGHNGARNMLSKQ